MKKLLIVLVICLTTLPLLWSQALTGRDIMQMADEAMKTDSTVTDMNMKLIDANGDTSIRRLQILMVKENGLSRILTVFKAPASVENTRFLTIENRNRDDDQWIYLPALRRMRRIAAGDRSNSFMGSDFSYADMESRNIDEYSHTLLGEENIDGSPCWVVESTPLSDSDAYSRTITYVDQEHHLPLMVEYYDKKSDILLKNMENSVFEKIDGMWTPLQIIMTTVDSGHRTVMEINQVKHNIAVDPGYFTTNYLQTGRVR
jgi:outer membrane lipoprotein-sorting protein